MYIGLMSGTSMDAIDAALVSFDNEKPNLLATESLPLPESIKANLLKLMRNEGDLHCYGEADTKLGVLFAETALSLIQKNHTNTSDILAIGSHGQTIYHRPNHTSPFTLQIGDPNIIAARTGITTVADFRRRDIALGGQGAPLTPAFHAYLFGRKPYHQWALNVGGIANITTLSNNPTEPILGFDTGPGNTLLDQWHLLHQGSAIDIHGRFAKSGKIIYPLLSRLLEDSYFKQPTPKSTGREYFNLSWLQTHQIDSFTPNDVQATLTELTAITIANAISPKEQSGVVWVCGGGVFNHYLMERIRVHCDPLTVKSTEEIGINPKWIEAMAFAWLAKQTLEKKPGNLPSVTGASQLSVLGGIYLP